MCIQGEKLLCELPSDEIITEKGKYDKCDLRHKLAYIECMLGSRVRGSPWNDQHTFSVC